MARVNRRRFVQASAGLLAWPVLLTVGATEEDAALRAAVDGAHRSAANRARNAARHPYETLRFFGITPRQRVIELAPGGGWYTEILAPYLREQGQLLLAAEAADDPDDYRRRSRQALDEKLARDPALYDRVRVGLLPRMPRAPRFADIAPAGGADLVLSFRNAHNWLQAGHFDATLRAAQAVLRPGGVLGLVEHRAAPGAASEGLPRSGYVPEDLVIARATAAGFVLDARSEINANPRDTKDHPNGVWSLPPSLRGGDVDRARFVAIGESDRFTHRYVKA